MNFIIENDATDKQIVNLLSLFFGISIGEIKNIDCLTDSDRIPLITYNIYNAEGDFKKNLALNIDESLIKNADDIIEIEIAKSISNLFLCSVLIPDEGYSYNDYLLITKDGTIKKVFVNLDDKNDDYWVIGGLR